MGSVPCLTELLRAQNEERARRFFDWLGDASERRRRTAEEAIAALVREDQGERVIRIVVQEILLGTETISLAALAVVASEFAPDDLFSARACRALAGLSNEDAMVYLCLFQHLDGVHIQQDKAGWLPTAYIDVGHASNERSWRDLREVFGIGQVEVFNALAGFVSRRLVAPDVARGRMGSGDDLAPSVFHLAPDTSRYFRILARAAEMAEPALAEAIGLPFDVEEVERLCTQGHPTEPSPEPEVPSSPGTMEGPHRAREQ